MSYEQTRQRIQSALATEGPDSSLERPVHDLFGLSYAAYLVLQRTLMEEMPLDWQRRLVALVNEMADAFPGHPGSDFMVKLRGEDGRFVADPLADYRRPDRDLIARMRLGPL